MNLRAAISLLTLTGLASSLHAQGLFRLTYSWQEVQGLTTTPVTSPNSIIDVGESARITLNVQALFNGTSPIGQTISYTPPPPPGVATIRGISHFWYDLRGDGGASTAAGTWGARSIMGLPGAISEGPFVMQNGVGLSGIGTFQFVAPGGTASGMNPFPNLFRGVWQPVSYAPRTVHFAFEPNGGSPVGQHSGFIAAYGITQPNPNDPTTWYDNFVTVHVPSTDAGSGLNIPIAPSPSAVSVLALSLLIPRRKRTREMHP